MRTCFKAIPACSAKATALWRAISSRRESPVSYRFLLRRGVNDRPLELGRLDGVAGDSRVDGGLEQFLHASLADGQSEGPALRGIARQTHS